MEQKFVFNGKLKTTLFILMGIGAVCMLWTILWGGENANARFWSNFLQNSIFFTGVAFLSLFLIAAKILAYSGWHSLFKRIMEAMSLFLPVGLLLLVVLIAGTYFHWHHLFHWADAPSVEADKLLQHKSSFLNMTWLTAGTIVIIGLWIFFAYRYRSLSAAEDNIPTDANYSHFQKMKRWAAIFMPLGGFSSGAIVWLWIMSIDAHWYSTLFAWYTTASWLVTCVAFFIIFIIYLKSKGYLEVIGANHLHDLGKYLFGFSIFWTYLWFSQFMLIWYGNNGEETIYFKTRQDEYPAAFYLNLIVNFALPFFILLRNDTKRKLGSMAFVAGLVIVGHWLDFFLMVKPGVIHSYHEIHEMHDGHDAHHDDGATKHIGEVQHDTEAHAVQTSHEEGHGADEGHGGHGEHTDGHGADEGHDSGHSGGFVAGFTFPGVLELGTFFGFLGLFLYIVFANLAKLNLIPKNDPYVEEAKHHAVWPF